ADGDRVEVCARWAADLHAAHALRHWPAPEAMRFVADAHLGRMGRMLDGA
ncbi:MAG: hypothetical protein JNL99_10245, partial [Zoogloea sp.]|nr:hypothetical protein [Zoogloea sp.]